jgi:hypothetical protein
MTPKESATHWRRVSMGVAQIADETRGDVDREFLWSLAVDLETLARRIA